MKTAIKVIFVCLVSCPLVASGQFTKGSKYIGGTLGYNTSSDPDAPIGSIIYSNSVSLDPTFGFLVGEGLAIGPRVSLGYGYYEALVNPTTKYYVESKNFSVGLFVSKYMSLADRFWFSLSGRLSYGRRYQDPTTGPSVAESSTISAAIQPGFLFTPNSRWAVSLNFGTLAYVRREFVETKTTQNIVDLSLGDISFGLLYLFANPQ